ncbi:MAG: hypothetical protein LUB59_04975 [Candidatus Gastranaerophilales bacterium]|nr:hypothetical protein [Candidatus Gastranaerophilales bacterium]
MSWGGSITFANSYDDNIQIFNTPKNLTTADFSMPETTLIASSGSTLPELNKSTDLTRNYNFDEGEEVTLEENMGTTSSGMFTITGADSDNPNTINFNGFSGFIISRVQTTLNISNVTISGAQSTIGSVIYNTASDASISITNVNFESNSTLSQSDALGGAIYSNGNLTLTNTSFTGNSAVTQSENGEAKGGAIYARNSVQMIADNDNVVIVDNYTQTASGEQENNAVYMNNSSSTLTISAVNSGSFSIYDSIDGSDGYSVVLTGDGTGKIGLFNSIYNANISVSNVDITLAEGSISSVQLDNITVGNNVNFIIDVDLANEIADTIIASNSSGTVCISEISILSASEQDSVTLQVLKNSDNLTLNIDALTSKLVTTLQSTMYNDSVLADSIELASTETDNDSITITGWQDILYEMVHDSDPTHMIKNFIFNTDTEYVLTTDLGEMVQESILTIYNLSNAEYGTINANGHSMFELVNPISSVNLKNIIIKNASTSSSGSVVYLNNTTVSFTAENSVITGNSSDGNGGAIYAQTGTISLSDSTLSENYSGGDGGAIYAAGEAQVELVNVDFINNTSDGNGGAIYAGTDVTISANGGTSTFEGNTANGESNAIYAGSDATVTLDARNGGTITMNDKISGEDGYNLNVTGNSSGNVIINDTVSNANITLSGSTLTLAEENLLAGNIFNASGGTLNLINGEIGTTDFSTLTTSGKTNVAVDVDLANLTMDRITADTYSQILGTINVSKMNLLSDSSSSTIKIYFADSALKDHVTTSVKTVAYSKVYKYIVSYSSSSGYFIFNRGDGKDASSYNPAILPAGISQQTAYMNQLNNYQTAMYHSDTYMMLPKKIRLAGGTHYAIDFDDIEGETFIQKYLAIPEEIKSIWVRPYASFETIPLKRGPDVSSINYGTLFGGDSDMIDLPHGFKFVYGGYAGYNGNSTSYSNVDSLQQGAVVGGTAYLYKGNFFNTITANIGWMINDSETAYGTDSFYLLMTGFSDRIGYNIELNSGKLILQPSIMMGYTFVYSSDYTTSNDVDIDTEPLHVMHFAPCLKIISNLENGWQPYAIISIMCNFIDKTNFTANTIRIPQMSIDPYVEYGLGIQKRWHDKYSGFAQATVRNGGRRGVSLLFGFRYMLGKIISREHFIVRENLGKKKVLFKEKKEPEIEVEPLDSSKTVMKPAMPYPEEQERKRVRFSVIDCLKKVSRVIFFKYNTDVSAKVVTDVFSDGVIRTTINGMENTKTRNRMKSDFRDKDLENKSTVKNDKKTDKKEIIQKLKPAVEINKDETENIQKPVSQAVQSDAVKSVPAAQTVPAKPRTETVQKPASQAVQLNTADKSSATVIKAPHRPIVVKPLPNVNKRNLYLNQNKYAKPVKAVKFTDYETEVADFKF